MIYKIVYYRKPEMWVIDKPDGEIKIDNVKEFLDLRQNEFYSVCVHDSCEDIALKKSMGLIKDFIINKNSNLWRRDFGQL